MAKEVAGSRLGRIARLAALSGRVGGNLVARAADRLAGRDPGSAERRVARQLVATLGQMKGVAQKVGQALSMDLDHLPPEVREIIASLQGASQPLDADAIAEAVEKDLGAPPEKLFAEFERQPFAAASLGQVHRARMADGRAVAVKVQYPGVGRALDSDLKNIGALVRTMGILGGSLDGEAYYDEVRREVALEIDYRREAASCRRFAALLQRFPELVVPAVIAERSGARVLTLELLEGRPLSEIVKAPSALPAADRYRIACQLATALFGPFLAEGAIHADPHPGNFLVLPDGRLGVLDFGAVKQLSDRFTQAHREVYRCVLDRRIDDPAGLLERAGFTLGQKPAQLEPLLRQVFDIIRRSVDSDFYDFASDSMSVELRALARANVRTFFGIRPPPEGLLFFRALFGQLQNYRALQAAGDFRACYQRMLDLSAAVVP